RDEYVDESLRADGRGLDIPPSQCPVCERDVTPDIRCRDCVGRTLCCAECACRLHARTPLHSVERWNGSFFRRTTLADLGLSVQLGHSPGALCRFRVSPRRKFTVIHTNGIHTITLYFCGCGINHGVPPRSQLRRFGWWPATPLEPLTAATEEVLKQFHLLNLQGNTTGYDFYRALELYTDNTGLAPPAERLPSFMSMVRQYRHIKMLKRSARGHSVNGVGGTKPGECAVLCPACPQPGLNLPPDWESAPEDQRWLFRRIVAIDANFRLKNRMRSSNAVDPGLGTGFSYFVEQDGYNEHVAKFATQEEISTCSGFASIANANTKNTKGLRSTGVGAISCAKHEFWLPNGMGDLQRGERYCNMDYIFLSGIRGLQGQQLLISYDIACQWSKNLWDRMEAFPQSLRLAISPSDVDYAVPKFHMQAHGEDCQTEFNLHLKRVGMTDGEGPERNWAMINGKASSTKEMGPGGRHDTLDDACGHANWRKVVNMG
ncbi:hypothetical protein FA95DRAFT_1476165, partial [Auriscalpium vulgare]